MLGARVVLWVVVQHLVDVLRRCGEPFGGTPKKTAVGGLWIHVNDTSDRGPERVVLTMTGRKLEIVDVDN